LLSLFHGFPICPEQNIYQNIALLKSLWNYLSNVWSFIENGVQIRELCIFYFSVAYCPKLISGRAALGDSGITTCRNLWLSWFLICWSHFSIACCPKLISGRVALGDSGIITCRNLRLSWFLICWSRNFMALLNIQKYSVFSFLYHA
jgi:hypothetical protein